MSDETVEVELHIPKLRKGVEPGGGPTPVERLQHILNSRGFDLVVDGDFGPKTESAVKSFQGNSGLEADGIVGRLTWTELLSVWLLSSEPG